MSSPCIECEAIVEAKRRNDGHFYKECDNCGHIGGPYISDQNRESSSSGQASLMDF